MSASGYIRPAPKPTEREEEHFIAIHFRHALAFRFNMQGGSTSGETLIMPTPETLAWLDGVIQFADEETTVEAIKLRDMLVTNPQGVEFEIRR